MAVEVSIADKLRLLWSLQQIDSQLDEIQILKGELPMEVADLEDEVTGLETRIKKLKAVQKESELEISKMQSAAKEADANIKKYQKQLEEVKNKREHDALEKEIELAKLDIQLSDKRVREAKMNLESKKESLQIAESRFEAKRAELESKKVELQGIIDKTEKEEQKLREQSQKSRVGIEARILNAYDKIRRTYRNGLAVVTVDRSSCGGCFNSVPPQIQLEVGLHKKIIACDHCGRILADHSIAHPELAEA
jgi:uncharacterized protein